MASCNFSHAWTPCNLQKVTVFFSLGTIWISQVHLTSPGPGKKAKYTYRVQGPGHHKAAVKAGLWEQPACFPFPGLNFLVNIMGTHRAQGLALSPLTPVPLTPVSPEHWLCPHSTYSHATEESEPAVPFTQECVEFHLKGDDQAGHSRPPQKLGLAGTTHSFS